MPIPLTVCHNEKNASNAFWKPLQGCPGVMLAQDADGLIDVSIDRGADTLGDRYAVVKGVLMERVQLGYTMPELTTVHYSVWRRLLPTLWIGTVVTTSVLLLWAVFHR
jgi:hypothetical protein